MIYLISNFLSGISIIKIVSNTTVFSATFILVGCFNIPLVLVELVATFMSICLFIIVKLFCRTKFALTAGTFASLSIRASIFLDSRLFVLCCHMFC